MHIYCENCKMGIDTRVAYEYENPEGDYLTTRLWAIGICPRCGQEIRILRQDIGEPTGRDIEYHEN